MKKIKINKRGLVLTKDHRRHPTEPFTCAQKCPHQRLLADLHKIGKNYILKIKKLGFENSQDACAAPTVQPGSEHGPAVPSKSQMETQSFLEAGASKTHPQVGARVRGFPAGALRLPLGSPG